MPFGGYILVGASLCGGWSWSYLCRFFQAVAQEMTGIALSEEEAYARLNALAREVPPGAEGMTADTRFMGTRLQPAVRGGFAGIDDVNLTAGNMARAVVEGMVRELAELAGRAGSVGIERLVAAGAGARRNPLVPDIIQQVFGLPCTLSRQDEEAALGAACCAAVGLGLAAKDDVP